MSIKNVLMAAVLLFALISSGCVGPGYYDGYYYGPGRSYYYYDYDSTGRHHRYYDRDHRRYRHYDRYYAPY